MPAFSCFRSATFFKRYLEDGRGTSVYKACAPPLASALVQAPPAAFTVENSTFFYIPFPARSATRRGVSIHFYPQSMPQLTGADAETPIRGRSRSGAKRPYLRIWTNSGERGRYRPRTLSSGT
ncbi:protein of unknown function [Methanoculleus bourgensis]|uniref:Uncharacterized protein n=1 Tax=Methanoculleus bourgensis TaxID=83986 RepID=A0A0X3BMQ9_9EURY|nr:protein of unknown function [Methanoculleus bourgensis]